MAIAAVQHRSTIRKKGIRVGTSRTPAGLKSTPAVMLRNGEQLKHSKLKTPVWIPETSSGTIAVEFGGNGMLGPSFKSRAEPDFEILKTKEPATLVGGAAKSTEVRGSYTTGGKTLSSPP